MNSEKEQREMECFGMTKTKVDDLMKMVILGGENRRITYKYLVGKSLTRGEMI